MNELDQELEKRGHRYCRWADDFLVLLKSERAAKRVMEGITGYLENNLNLPVHWDYVLLIVIAPVRVSIYSRMQRCRGYL